MNYYVTFIPGLGELIAELVRERLPDAVIHRLLDESSNWGLSPRVAVKKLRAYNAKAV